MQLVRRLKRELMANPAKAAVLGVLLIVAVWFWIPLIAGKSNQAPPAASSPASGSESVVGGDGGGAAQTLAAGSPTSGAPSTNVNPLKWKQAVEAIRRDPSMQPALPLADARDPFRRDESRIRDAEALAAATAAPRMTPAQAGIQLNSTAVGPKKRTALIGGKAYREGDTVRAAKGNGAYKLVEIRRQSIMLEQDGARYQVWIPRAEPVSFED